MSVSFFSLTAATVAVDYAGSTSQFSVGAALAALKESDKLPSELASCDVTDLVLVVSNSSGCSFPSQATKWSHLHLSQDDTHSLFVMRKDNPILRILESRGASMGVSNIDLMTAVSDLESRELLGHDEGRHLMRIARSRHNPLHEPLCNIYQAFGKGQNGSTQEAFLREARDLLATELPARSGRSGAASTDANTSFLQRMRRTRLFTQRGRRGNRRPDGDADGPEPASDPGHIRHWSQISQKGRAGTRSMVGHSDTAMNGDASPSGEQDIMWVLASLGVAFFSFIAMATQSLFVTTHAVFLGPLIHLLTGLVALYDVFGYRSILGYDLHLQMIGGLVCDFLLVAFVFNILLELNHYGEAILPKLEACGVPYPLRACNMVRQVIGWDLLPSTSLSVDAPVTCGGTLQSTLAMFVTDEVSNLFGGAISLFWLAALRCEWKRAPQSDSVMAVIITLTSLYLTAMVQLFLSSSTPIGHP